MTLMAKAATQETRGSQRYVHCQVYEQTVDASGTTNDHRSDLDFDVILAASASADELKLLIAERLQELTPPAIAPTDLVLPDSMTSDQAAVLIQSAATAEETPATPPAS